MIGNHFDDNFKYSFDDLEDGNDNNNNNNNNNNNIKNNV